MATIKDVARLAGVSFSTVSYVLSGSRPIGEETRQRVLAAIDELGYEANASARALRSTQTRVLALQGFVTAGHTEAGVTGLFIIAIADAVRERGYDLLLLSAHEGTAGIERLSRTSMADAVIVMGILLQDPRVSALRRLAFPAALIGHPQDDAGISWVDLDFRRAGRVAMELLAGEGRHTVAFLGPPAEVYDSGAGYAVRALAGAQEVAAESGVALRGPHRVERIADIAGILERLFEAEPDTHALVLHYERALPEILRWLRGSGRRVPEDVHVVLVGAWGRDTTESQVTYVSSTVERMASAAVDLAIAGAMHEPARSVLLAPDISLSP